MGGQYVDEDHLLLFSSARGREPKGIPRARPSHARTRARSKHKPPPPPVHYKKCATTGRTPNSVDRERENAKVKKAHQHQATRAPHKLHKARERRYTGAERGHTAGTHAHTSSHTQTQRKREERLTQSQPENRQATQQGRQRCVRRKSESGSEHPQHVLHPRGTQTNRRGPRHTPTHNMSTRLLILL